MVGDKACFHASVRGARPAAAPRRTRRGGRRRGSFLRTVAGGACKKKSTRRTIVLISVSASWRPTVALVHPKSLGARKAAVLSNKVQEEDESQKGRRRQRGARGALLRALSINPPAA